MTSTSFMRASAFCLVQRAWRTLAYDHVRDSAAVCADAGVELAQDGVSGRDLRPGEVHLVGPVLQLEELHPVPVGLSVQGLGGATGHLDLVECGLAGLVEDLSGDCGEEGPGVATRVAVARVTADQHSGLAGGDQFLVDRVLCAEHPC